MTRRRKETGMVRILDEVTPPTNFPKFEDDDAQRSTHKKPD